MKLNKKGFTLIELLAVVVILLAISVIAVSSITAAIERNKKKQNDAKIEVILSYAKLHYEANKNSMSDLDHDGWGEITLGELDLSDAEWKDADGNDFNGIVCYEIGEENGKTIAKNFKYESDGDC